MIKYIISKISVVLSLIKSYLIKYSGVITMSVIYGLSFGIIETFFRQFNNYFVLEKPEYGFTTFTQFILTTLWTPFFVYHKQINNCVYRGALFPINIYLCEIIGGSILLYVFDTRVWHYSGEYALLNGLISLEFYPLWLLIFIIEDNLYKHAKGISDTVSDRLGNDYLAQTS